VQVRLSCHEELEVVEVVAVEELAVVAKEGVAAVEVAAVEKEGVAVEEVAVAVKAGDPQARIAAEVHPWQQFQNQQGRLFWLLEPLLRGLWMKMNPLRNPKADRVAAQPLTTLWL